MQMPTCEGAHALYVGAAAYESAYVSACMYMTWPGTEL
jgi:hypothetical protein